jgi:hypothetical protein
MITLKEENKMLVEKELNSNFQQVLENILVEGKDYYKPNFLSKPYLLNSGAKKICNILELEKDYKISKEIHNYEQNLITFRVRYTLRKGNEIVSKGIGEHTANNRNKSLAIAKRKALIDAVLKILNLNNIFTRRKYKID